MKQIIIDTETTGLEPEKGHRIIEIGCIELDNRQPTGNSFHCYLNPESTVTAEALAVHGITNEFLKDKQLFANILQDFLAFIQGSELIAHNASFDVGFINYEIKRLNKNHAPLEHYVTIFDTLPLARKRFPGQRNTLDAICKRYKINLTERQERGHGALRDAQLLATVYLLMTSGQSDLFTDYENTVTQEKDTDLRHSPQAQYPKTPVIYATTEEIATHNNLLIMIKKNSGKCLWQNTQ